jgi:hypothetical protein
MSNKEAAKKCRGEPRCSRIVNSFYVLLKYSCPVKILTMTEERKKLNDSDSYATITTAQTQCKHQQTVIWIGNLILCTECVFLYFHTGIVLKLLHYSIYHSFYCRTWLTKFFSRFLFLYFAIVMSHFL